IFQGKNDLFRGLHAEQWVNEQKEHLNFVLYLDLSALSDFENKEELNNALIDYLDEIVDDNNLNVCHINNAGRYLKK
ncbi:MAG: hypothetical protein K6E40_05115, partial [Desulfovibrio sp.]|nr:hypothetical protein [Desulfovibrio sp.]